MNVANVLFWCLLIPLNFFVIGWLYGARRTRRMIQRHNEAAWREYLLESGFDPEECAEVHLAGDCPLCGGE